MDTARGISTSGGDYRLPVEGDQRELQSLAQALLNPANPGRACIEAE